MQWQNNINDICFNQADLCDKLKQFFVIQLDWIYTQIDSYPNDEYWHHVFERKPFFSVCIILIYLD
jgi:hypothetical protein